MRIRVEQIRIAFFDWSRPIFLKWLIAAAALLVILGCDSAKPHPVPPELLGTWRTQDPRYAGLYFKIDAANFSYSTVEGTVESYAIINYEQLASAEEGRVRTHVLHGSRDGQKLRISLSYEPLGGGRFKFKNQDKTFWTRDHGQER